MAERAGDCDDSSSAINPDAKERCNGFDDDCDGEIDEELGETTCGLGVCQHTVPNCKDGQPQVCDPMEGAGPEVCGDSKDNNCDGEVDEVPCNYVNSFDDSGSIADFDIARTCSQCTATWNSSGSFEMYCPDNCDIFAILKPVVTDGTAEIHLMVDLYSWEWYDGAPRNGVSFVAPNAIFGAWGPNPGYDFLISDPYDSLQGSGCPSDRCPSITKSNGVAILAMTETTTSAGTTYALDLTMQPALLKFQITQSGASVAILTSGDAAYRQGRLALHCSESRCRFDNLRVELSPSSGYPRP